MPAPPDPQRSHYRILGVADRATTKEIRVAYLNLARALHPDRYTDSPTGEKRLAERRMREVNDSYTVLSDASRRHCPYPPRPFNEVLAAILTRQSLADDLGSLLLGRPPVRLRPFG